MSDLCTLGLREAAAAIRDGSCTSQALVTACIEQITEREGIVRAFRDLDAEGARAQAKDRDATTARGMLHGVPVAVKECYDVAGRLCTWGTPIHAQRRAATDAALVQRLRDAGAVILGTTISTEYAIAAAGPTTNPWDPARTPGGSSSGSAAAVAANMVPLAIGSQAVGSIVRPSVYCGVFGLKPTKGAISGYGGMPLSQFLDHPGPIARSATDLMLACQVLFDEDTHDPYSRAVEVPVPVDIPSDLTVLVVEGPLEPRIETASREALAQAREVFERAGVTTRQQTLPSEFDQHVECLETILAFECALNHGEDRDDHGPLMSERMREIVDRGRRISKSTYAAALDRAAAYRQTLLSLLAGHTIVLAAATDGTAPAITAPGTGSNQLQGLWTLAWLPVLAVPTGMDAGLPVGVQLIAADGREDLLLSASRLIEDV